MADYEIMLTQKRLRRKQMITTLSIVAVVLIAAIVIISGRRKNAEKERAAIHNDDHVVNLSVVGDITIDNHLLADALQPDGSYNFLPFFLEISEHLYKADLTIGNLEMCFAGEPYGEDYTSAPEEYAKVLKLLGFDILQTANSKTISAGLKGMESTIDVITRNGMTPIGSYTSKSDKAENSVLIKEINGIRIAFVSFTKGFDGMAMPTGREYISNILYKDYDSMYSEVDSSAITAVVENAKKQNPDIIIALVHWGSAYKLDISESQQVITGLMLENGVDVILGTHSHVVGKMEYTTVTTTDKKTKDCFVAYSLGNLITTDSSNYVRDGVILNLTISKDDTTGETIIKSVEYTPTYVWDAGESYPDRYKVIDLYHAIEQYDTTYLGRVTDTGFNRLKNAIEDLRANTKSDFDLRYLAEQEALAKKAAEEEAAAAEAAAALAAEEEAKAAEEAAAYAAATAAASEGSDDDNYDKPSSSETTPEVSDIPEAEPDSGTQETDNNENSE